MKKFNVKERLQDSTLWQTFALCVAIAVLAGAVTSVYARFSVPLQRVLSFVCLSTLLIVSVSFLLRSLHKRIHGEKLSLRTVGFVFVVAVCEIVFSFLSALLITYVLTMLSIPILTASVVGLETVLGMIKSLLLYPLLFCAPFAVILEKSVDKAYWTTLLCLVSQRYFVLLLAAVVCVGFSTLAGIFAPPLFAKILSVFLTSLLLAFSVECCMQKRQENVAQP